MPMTEIPDDDDWASIPPDDDRWLVAPFVAMQLRAERAERALRAALAARPQPLFKGSPATFRKIIGDDILGPDLPAAIVVYPVVAGSATPPGDNDGEAFTRILTEWFDSPGADHDKWNHEKWEADDE